MHMPPAITLREYDRCCGIVHKALALVGPVFRLDIARGLHGIPHWSRVWYHGRRLAAAQDLDPALSAWFAFLHDSQRHGDGFDPEHGARAADFAQRLRRDGMVNELTRSQFEQLCEAMKLHSSGRIHGEPAMMVCWDADRLDLLRAGIRPDPARMCTAMARRGAVINHACRMAQRQRGDARERAGKAPASEREGA